MANKINEMMLNTVQFRFSPGSPRPSWVDISNFLKQLDTDLLLMESAYKTARERSLFIKFSSQDAEMTLKKNRNHEQLYILAENQWRFG